MEVAQKWIEWFVFFPVRFRHRRRAAPKHKARIDALRTTKQTLARAVDLNLTNIRTVFNVGLYVLLLDQDMAYFTDDLVYALGNRRRAFLAKHEAVLLYEAGEDLRHLLGKEFRESVKAIGASPDQIAALNAVSSELNQFWQNQKQFLGPIRNALAAHRDHDALQYANALDVLKPLEVMARAADFSQLLSRLIRVITELSLLAGAPASIVRDFLTGLKPTTK